MIIMLSQSYIDIISIYLFKLLLILFKTIEERDINEFDMSRIFCQL